MKIERKCRRGDSNPHGLPHTALNRACLPNSTTSAMLLKIILPNPVLLLPAAVIHWAAAVENLLLEQKVN